MKKNTTAAATFIFIFYALYSCGKAAKEDEGFKPSENYALYVTGDKGVEFSGAVGMDGAAASVSGVTPKEFSYKDGRIISGSFQKKNDNAKTLKVECYIYKTKRKEANTKEPYGVVAAACSDSTTR